MSTITALERNTNGARAVTDRRGFLRAHRSRTSQKSPSERPLALSDEAAKRVLFRLNSVDERTISPGLRHNPDLTIDFDDFTMPLVAHTDAD
jgi:hypothetical protein